MRFRRFLGLALVFAVVFLFFGSRNSRAQAPTPESAPAGIQAIEVSDPGGQILSFRHLSGSTVVDMRGTKLEPNASTRLKIESRRGFLELDINRGEIKGLRRAREFGKDFHTYVLWTVSVDGAAMNLGEITFDETGPVSINVTTPYQTFWLMVTAEPDYAVNDPSPLVVLYSINQDSIQTASKALPVPGKLLYYTYYGQRYETSPAPAELAVPNELLQARKAIELASESGILAVAASEGEPPLPDEVRTRETFERARTYLNQAEESFRTGGNTNEAIQFARTAAQIAENARALALGAVGGLYVRKLDRELEKVRGEAAACRKELAALREKVEKLEADLAAARQRLQDAENRIQALASDLEAARKSIEQAQAENAQLREDREAICGELRRQLASLGQLTEHGGNMVLTLASDILFDFGSFELRPVARENLAKLTVLRMLLFPSAQVRYEGHTDRPGEEDYNQWLSEQRALAVQRYFVEEALSREADPAARGTLTTRLVTVERLSRLTFAASKRNPSERQQLLTELGTVIGKGEREPVEDVPGQSERNRRVVLLFPPAEMGQASSLCQSPPGE
jgi:outer membrane protein OmpA-like peptidoglycan-associated protein